MAAGMGSRYGGLKQIDPVGTQGEAILDYSLYDAYAAGFRTAVIIIKETIREEFMQTVGKRLEKCPMEIRYAYQELTALPEGFAVPEGRTKPWGTCHAVLCAADAIGGGPFAVINADDYYGKSAYQVMFDYLQKAEDGEKADYCMVGYQLGNTVTEHGSVARGVCTIEDGKLTRITERTRIEMRNGGIYFTEDGGESWTELPPETTVSMNLLGFTGSFLQAIASNFPAFLRENVPVNPQKCEFYLPMLVSQLLQSGKAEMTVLQSADKWFGVTYAADKPLVQAAIRDMTTAGKYPDGLWK
jgi:choline kinase